MKLLPIVTTVVCTLKIIGLAPFSQQTKPCPENSCSTCHFSIFRFSTMGFVYNFLFLIMIQVVAVFAVPILFSSNYPNSSTLTLTIDLVQGIACCFTTDVIIFSWAFCQNNAALIMNKLSEIDCLLSGIENEPASDRRTFIFLSVQIIFNTCLWVSFVATEVEILSGLVLAIIFIDLPILVIYYFVLEYFLVVRIVAINFERVNKNLLKLVKFQNCSYRNLRFNDHLPILNSSNNTPFPALQLLGITHTRLVDVSREIADFFSFPILLSIGCFFITLLYNLYYIISPVFVSSDDFSLSATGNGIAWALVSVYPVTLLSLIVTKAGNEAKLTAQIVHKLLATPLGQATKEKLKQFSLQLLHEQVSFTAYGFFTLDCTMLHSILGAVATYLVILIQFQLTNDTSNDYTLPVQKISGETNRTI